MTVDEAGIAGGPGGGVSDHGALTGLADDDHSQYHNDTRGDIRYYLKAAVDALVGARQAADADLTAIAGLSPSNDDILQRKAGAWAARTMAQLKADLALAKGDVGLGSVDNTADSAKPVSTAQQTALDLKAPLASPTFTGTVTVPNDSFAYAKFQNVSATDKLLGRSTAGAGDIEEIPLTAAGRALIDDADAAAQRTTLGLGNVDNTSDANKPVSTAQATADALKVDKAIFDANTILKADADDTPIALAVGASQVIGRKAAGGIVSMTMAELKAILALVAADLPAHATLHNAGGADALAIDAAAATGSLRTLGTTSTSAARGDSVPNASYRHLLDSSGSHIAARVAGTYGLGQGDPAAITGTGTLYPLNTIYIDQNDFPSVGGLAAKLRLRAVVHCNDVAPFTGTFVFGLHPITRPATSGGAGLVIYTIGAAVAGSTATLTNPAADSSNNVVGSDFAVPASGHYVVAFVTNATMAASSHVHISTQLQMRNA